MATPPRLNSITYAGTKIGEGTSYDLMDVHTLDEAYDTLTLAFDVFVRATTAANLKTAVDTLKAAIRKPDQDLIITIGGSNFKSLSHANGTGFNSRGSIASLETHRTNKTRAYRINIEVGLPADLSGRNYRQSSEFTVEDDVVGRKSVAVTATYTANGSTKALAQAIAQFPTYAGTIKTLATGDYDDPDPAISYTPDGENKLCVARATYPEIIFPQDTNATVGSPDSATLVNPQYNIQVVRTSQPQWKDSGATDPIIVVVGFDAPVKKSASQDLDDVVDTLIKPWLRTLAASYTDGGVVSPVDDGEDIHLDYVRNRVRGQVSFTAITSSLIRMSVRVRTLSVEGNSLVPVMDGDPESRDLHESPSFRFREYVVYALEVGTLLGSSGFALTMGILRQQAEADGFIHKGTQEEYEEFRRQVPGASTRLTFTEQAGTMRFEFGKLVSKSKKSEGGGSGGRFRTGQTRAGPISPTAGT